MSRLLGTLLVLTAASVALAATDIPLVNGDFESSPPGYNNPIPGWNGGGGDFNHADVGIVPPPELGLQFGFLGSGDPWGEWQATAVTLEVGYTYTFDSWLLVRNVGALPLGIGYLDEANAPKVLATVLYGAIYPEWTHVGGVSYTPTAGSPGLGRPLIVGYAGNPFGLHESDTWFDNAHASYAAVPEPAALVALALGLLVARRR
jgi:hypothetical protein